MTLKMDLLFPYDKVRDEQNNLIEEIIKAVTNNTNLIAHAPTGLGKTAAALSPLVKLKQTLFFITPRHTQHKIVIETLQQIKAKHNVNISVVDFLGKKAMCLQPGIDSLSSAEFADYCKEQVKKDQCIFYQRLKRKGKLTTEAKAVIEKINNNIYHAEEVKQLCRKHKLCPYEIAAQAGKKAKVIIADYFHILNPHIRETLLAKTEKELDNSIIIIDEAHNLPERCRTVLSDKLTTYLLEMSEKEARSLGYKDMADDILILNNILEKLVKKMSIEQNQILITKQEFIDKVKEHIDYEELIGNLAFISEQVLEKKERSFTKSIAAFLKNWPGQDKGFIRILNKGFTHQNKPYISLKYNCMDPSLILKPLSEQTHSLICMSGTLNPTKMYKDLFGFEAIEKEFKSPFPQKNKLNIIVPDTTTKYTARNPYMYEKIAKYCSDITNLIPGNTLIFFPSYKLRDEINQHFQTMSDKTIFTEVPQMTKQEKTEMLDKFKKYKEVGAALLAASSGNFGEGIDLMGDFLKAVIIVGLPLGKPNLETEQLIKYYDEKFKKGWEYGYTLPALIKTFQNAGRCIRSETDKGIVVYLDQRYTWDNYFKCFPKDEQLRISKDPFDRIKTFFDNWALL